MKSMKLSVGLFAPVAVVEVTNKQSKVEYKVIEGSVTQKEIRRTVGNMHKRMYQKDYSGYYLDRKEVLDRLNKELEETLKKVEELKFAINVTKKRTWEEV